MNIRHAAALALVGWYLMVPVRNDSRAPISQWYQAGDFDTPEECRAALAWEITKEYANQAGSPTAVREYQRALVHARCISPIDVRFTRPAN